MVIIRLYKPNDLENTVQLWYRTWHYTFPHLQHPQPYTAWKERFRDRLAQQRNVWLAELENQIVGFVVVIKKNRN